MSDHGSATPTRFLILEDQRRRGCRSWSKPGFLRLCAKLNETEPELAARIGIRSITVLHRRYRQGFQPAEGILLTLLNETIDAMKTGALR